MILLAEAPPAAPCPPEVHRLLTQEEGATDAPHALTCSLSLGPGERVARPLRLEGEAASGVHIRCDRATLGDEVPDPTWTPTVMIVSVRADGTASDWSRPTGVVISGCRIEGSVRVWGMGAGGDYAALRTSSRQADHTERLQAIAPTRIALQGVEIVADGAIPLYVGPGATQVSLTNSVIEGRSRSVLIYLDAESANHRIEGNVLSGRAGRELIAVDGSADNLIQDNRATLRNSGGVFLYRNCGERGVIRHQPPSGNSVRDNRFELAAWVWPWSRLWPRAVVEGSRQGRQSYCGDDAGYPYGSSVDDGDAAGDNRIHGNRVIQFPGF